MKKANLHLVGFLLLVGGVGCSHVAVIPGTSIPATEANREIIDTVEDYRQRLVERNVEGLLLLASDKYFEDGGTPESSDDYGYAGLSTVLSSRLQRVQSIRYDIQYKSVKIGADGRAEVEAFLSGAFDLQGEVGERYRKVSDFHRFVLERSAAGGASKWKFVSGM
jgi:hypothetical protein